MQKKGFFLILVLAALCLFAVVALAETYHTVEGLEFGMTLGEFKDWLAVNATNGREPTLHEDDIYTSYGDLFADFYIEQLDMTGLIVQGVFHKDLGLCNVLLGVREASYTPFGGYPEQTESEGIARAINAFFKILDIFTEEYGPWDDSHYSKAQGNERITLPFPEDREQIRAELEACDGTYINLLFDNVFIRYGTGINYSEHEPPFRSTLIQIIYWGPGMNDLFFESLASDFE